MAKNKNTKTKGKKKNPNEVTLKEPADGNREKRMAELSIDPSIVGSLMIQDYATCETFREVDTNCLTDALSEQIQVTNDNNLTGLESMLTAQAYTLNAMFNNLSLKAINNMGHDMSVADIFLKFGLRAQSQCRSTIEAISAVKNPPMMGYVKQANITQGPQQVNNGIDQGNTSRAGEKQNPKNELLEVKDGNQLDTGTQGQAIRDDSAMETVGKVNGT